jgi:amino acid transporter
MDSKNDHGSTSAQAPIEKTIGDLIVGPPKNIRDPRLFHRISLVAFLAWVGLGSDGLSSSCYGPEEAFLALGQHQYLAVFLALMTAITVFVIAASYSQTIDLFPSGGGGYLVATSLLGPYPGLVSGSALVVDYVLTIAISIASGADAIFSFLPTPWLRWKLLVCLFVVLLMIAMNLRGVRESVMSLVPIFVAFVLMHMWLIGYALISRGAQLPLVLHQAVSQAKGTAQAVGWFVLLAVFFRAYSMGGGTYTGIEAVSNGLPILREPKTVTGKRTMLYMAFSLAFIAGGILICYLLENVHLVRGQTLNAVLFEHIASNWRFGRGVITFALLTEGALLFVAAQTGFIDGPRVLATMAHDQWLPRRLSHLSLRLVTADGVLAMGVAAALILIGSRASVDALVVLYAINVFVTFTLSQLGMTVHWWKVRSSERRWIRKILVNGLGTFMTASILTLTLILKFDEGGWVTVLITGALIGLCLLVRRHYDRVAAALAELERQFGPRTHPALPRPAPPRDSNAPTAAVLVKGFDGLGLATLFAIQQLFPNEFRNIVFVCVGEVDSSMLKSHEEIEAFEKKIADEVRMYYDYAAQLGLHPETRAGIGPDPVNELQNICLEVAATFPRVVFFAGKLIWDTAVEGFLSRFLHNHTALELQSWLQLYGYSVVILPIRVGPPLRPPPRDADEAATADNLAET